MSANFETNAVVPEEKNYKCVLKLLGIDVGDLRAEEILESISNYVSPSAIKALFYDTFNCFYIVNFSDIKSACLLVGKVLQISSYKVHFLPLFDFFVVGNVYMSVTDGDLANIFSMFGKVFDIANHHVLPNSTKFFHVLSGTREIIFQLPGDDNEVKIPKTVIYPPYTFHVNQLCSLCLKHGHSLLNCPSRKDEVVVDLPQPVTTCSSAASNHDPKDSMDENQLIIKQEFLLSVPKEDHLNEIIEERVTTSEDSTSRKPEKSPVIETEILNINSSSANEEKNLEAKSSGSSRYLSQVSPLLRKYIRRVEGVLEPSEMVKLVQMDARRKKNVISFVSNITQDLEAVSTQLKRTLRKYLRDQRFNTSEFRFKRKLYTLINVLNNCNK